MAKHILLEQAYMYNSRTNFEKPIGCSFIQRKGYWTLDSTGQALMESDNPKPLSTKKCDVETGEDQKGE